MATKTEITAVLGLLQAEWPNYPVTPQTITVWQHAFADTPNEVLNNAAWHIITTGSAFFPHIAEIRKVAFKLQNNIPDNGKAWEEVRNAKPLYYTTAGNKEDGFTYSTRSHEWSSQIVEQAALSLGWPDDFPGDNEAADRAHFFRVYENLIDRAVEDGTMLPQVRQFKDGMNQQLADGIKKLVSKMED